MVLAELRLPDRECALIDRLRLGALALRLVGLAQVSRIFATAVWSLPNLASRSVSARW
jgi:hypothetical protein